MIYLTGTHFYHFQHLFNINKYIYMLLFTPLGDWKTLNMTKFIVNPYLKTAKHVKPILRRLKKLSYQQM